MAYFKTYLERIEILFWSIAIPLMPKSWVLQKAISWGYQVSNRFRSTPYLSGNDILWALVALTLGFTLGYLRAMSMS